MNNRKFYAAVRDDKEFDVAEYESLMESVSQERVEEISDNWGSYLRDNLSTTIDGKDDVSDYHLNPYAITAIAGILDLDTTHDISEFIFGSKLYMSLETAFGKSVENIVMPTYPIQAREENWKEHPEKIDEMRSDTRQEDLKWQKIDKYCVIDDTAYLATVKSGPRTLNESTTKSMKSDISEYSELWLEGTQKHHPQVEKMHVTVGLTYGTDNTTNNKEMRVLLKLVDDEGFSEKDREEKAGVIVHLDNDNITVDTCVGIDFWSYVGNPKNPQAAEFVFLEVLLGLIGSSEETGEILQPTTESKIQGLKDTIDTLALPESSLPEWVERDYGSDELVRLAQTLTLYYDDGFR